jgi:predicted nucleic acid-binding protein
MRRVFADTYYWIALLNDRDQGQAAARTATQALQGIPLVTTEEVLTEVLAFFCEEGRYLRQLASDTVRGLLSNPLVHVEPQSHRSFLAGLGLYEARQDKEYSLTDCVSMNLMRQEGISEVLTNDDHFAQEGFTKLL